MKNPQEALQVLQGVPAKQRTPKINMASAKMFQEQGMEHSAIATYKEVLRECPLTLEAAEGLSSLGVKGIEVNSIIMSCNWNLQNFDWLNAWIKAHAHINCKEYSQAVTTLRSLDNVNCSRDNHNLLVTMGECYYLSGNYKNSLLCLRRARLIEPDSIKGKTQQKDYTLKYSDHISDDDKQSSAYFTSTDHEQDTVKTSCNEETPYQSSIDSSRASSAADLHEDSRSRSHLRKITSSTSCNGLKYKSPSTVGFRHSIHGYHNGLDSRADSLQSHTSESTSTLEPAESLGTDSAIFDGNHKTGGSSGLPSLDSSIGDEPKLMKTSAKPIINRVQYMDPHSENNLIKYKTNANLNDIEIQDIDDDIVLKTQEKSTEQQQLHDDDDVSEATQTNDYYTVQETYTIEKNPPKGDQLLFPDDDCTITQTLSFMSVDHRDSQYNFPKSGLESTENLTETMHTAVASNSESCESFDSIERSEHALLELCIKSGVSKPDSLSSLRSSGNSKSFEANFRLGPISERSSIASRLGGFSNQDDRYRKQRDPDAMIASLDRLTATLVQQSEAMRERDSSTMKGSLLSDTWNEDSPND
ncbi:hypothetical protein QAD02_013879 [Eretmocerus hayati]|uniref:Uncharacterized protein n=1 Tax=Eretmocerus hayati TaxID=131215 RepID=A0ACC2P3Z6_9HYME|nr:hypothetical protein QAD02_013879 [Eretmocerus hayati]